MTNETPPIGTVRACWIEDDDPGDEDPSHRPNRVAIVDLDLGRVFQPVHQATFIHTVKV